MRKKNRKDRREKTLKNRYRSSFATTLVSISLVLFLLGIVGLLLLTEQKLSVQVKENIGFDVYLREDARDADIVRIQKHLDASPYVRSTEFISSQEALDIMKETHGDDFLDVLGYNPLPPGISVKLKAKYANMDSIARIETEFARFAQIADVRYRKDLIHLVNNNVRSLTIILLVFTGLLFFISFTLIRNTIRLMVYAKRFLIRTMQLVGATNSFIRRPFLITGALQGLFGSLVALFLLTGFIYFLLNQVEGFQVILDHTLIAILYLLVIFAGMFIAWVSSYIAVNKYLRMNIDDLYY